MKLVPRPRTASPVNRASCARSRNTTWSALCPGVCTACELGAGHREPAVRPVGRLAPLQTPGPQRRAAPAAGERDRTGRVVLVVVRHEHAPRPRPRPVAPRRDAPDRRAPGRSRSTDRRRRPMCSCPRACRRSGSARAPGSPRSIATPAPSRGEASSPPRRASGRGLSKRQRVHLRRRSCTPRAPSP